MALMTHRGMRFPLKKRPAADRPIEELTEETKIFLPLSLTGDAPAGQCVLKPYTTVLAGQVVARPADAMGVPVLSPVSGVYTEQQTVEHPLYGTLDCLVLDSMDVRRPAVGEAVSVDTLSAEQVIHVARQQAVTDELDGRPLCEKLCEWQAEGCDVLVGDAVENQPYASAAWETLNESAEQVAAGLRLAARAVGAADCHLAAQRLPANHRRALQQRLGEEMPLYTVRGKYPATRYTPKPLGKRVRRIGVQALLALYRAAAFHEPHTTCVVTVAGEAVASPCNLRVPFGTPAVRLLRQCGLLMDPTVVVFGDMLTGQAAADPAAPILPGVTCLLALTAPPPPAADICVGCGRCVQVCHAGLMPFAVLRLQETGHTETLARLHPEDCDACGACAAVCPAGRDLAALVKAAGDLCTPTHTTPEKGGDTE